MQVPIFRAKDRDSDKMVEGYYFDYPLATEQKNADGTSPIVQGGISNCIITYQPSASGLGFINEPVACTIDMTTLEFVKFVDVPCKTDTIII